MAESHQKYVELCVLSPPPSVGDITAADHCVGLQYVSVSATAAPQPSHLEECSLLDAVQEAFTTAYNCMGPSRASVGASMSEGVRASEASGLVSDSRQTATQSQALVRAALHAPWLFWLASSAGILRGVQSFTAAPLIRGHDLLFGTSGSSDNNVVSASCNGSWRPGPASKATQQVNTANATPSSST